MINHLTDLLTSYNPTVLNLAILSIVYWITWIWSINGEFVIDDQEGIQRFSDRFIQHKDKDGNIVKEELIDYYDHEENGKKTRFKNTQFNGLVGTPGSIIRWLRINLGKKFTVLGRNKNGHEIFGFIQSHQRHHLISLVVHYANVLLAYLFLSKLLGSNLAFLSVVLFIVHPVSCQTVAWISGIGYLLCLLGALLTFNLVLLVSNPYIITIATPLLTLISSYGLFSGAFNWIILLFMKQWIPALLAFSIFFYSFMKFGKAFVDLRVSEFKKQNMSKSTVITVRKPIVMLKTLWYYIQMLVFPKRLGLFHKWGYHYDETIERCDSKLLLGLLCAISLVLFYFVGDFPIQFGILWFVTYLLVFSNFITAMQFVVERYIFISSLGFCIIVAYLVKDYPVLYGLIVGIFLTRTLLHIPTFKSLLHFYQSNCWNFPDSEVAYGNLGVTYMNQGRANSAIDCWGEAIKINSQYDVPYYNLYSLHKNSGQLEMAKDFLVKCLNAKVVHFRDLWTKELADLEMAIKNKQKMDEYNKKINDALNSGNFTEFTKLKEEIQAMMKPPPLPTGPPNVPATS